LLSKLPEQEEIMSAIPTTRLDEWVDLNLKLLDEIMGSAAGDQVAVRLWDGTLWPSLAPRPVTLVLKHPGALRAMFLPGTELGLSEAYLYDDFDIEGDIHQVFYLADALAINSGNWTKKLRAARDLLRLPALSDHRQGQRGPARLNGKRHSIERDRLAVTYHYNVSNDFYRLYLDERMIYSCAYFASPETSLDVAQERKLEYICRKLRLRPGQKLLDVGCGWGGLVMYAAAQYGVDATGITLSQPQADLANQRIAAAGLADHCRVEVCDYRQIDQTGGFDTLVSVGMFEHVGAAMLPPYFHQAFQLLKSGGVFLNHGMARNSTFKPDPVPSFSDTYVFPDGELVGINVTLQAAENEGFEVRDVESLREHYILTLRHWVSRLENHHQEAIKLVDESIYRVWRLFMAGSAYGFTNGRSNLYQALLVKPGPEGQSNLPLTREEWYPLELR
jgi:cyclopropane-fatty-acyl-phospholipid synthase